MDPPLHNDFRYGRVYWALPIPKVEELQARTHVFIASKGLPGVGFTRPEWNTSKDMPSGTVTRTITDTTLPTGPIARTLEYQAPFTLTNRETDYATVRAKLDLKARGHFAHESSPTPLT